MSVMEETMIADVVFTGTPEVPAQPVDAKAYLENEQEVWSHNLEAMRVDTDALNAFLDLLSQADAEYMDATEYVQPEPQTILDWDAVDAALTESQQILIGVQKLLSQTLAEMGVEDHEYIRVYSDSSGLLRLVSDHPRRLEIEDALNSPANSAIRSLYQAATTGMSMAGGLVGRMSVPEEVLAAIKEKYGAAC